jgi:addiction module RelE/StbE family toxin
MYELRFHRKVDKEIADLPVEVKKKIKQEFLPLLTEKPIIGKPLSGELSGVWRLSFRASNTDYRIAYEIDENNKIVYVIMIGKREGFYERLKRRLQ